MPPDDPATPGDDVSELDELERLANEYEAAMTNEANEDLTRKQWVEAVVWAGEKLADAVRSSATGFRALTADRDAHRAAAQEAEAERDTLRRAVEIRERQLSNAIAAIGRRKSDVFVILGDDGLVYDVVRKQATGSDPVAPTVKLAPLAPAAPPGDAGTGQGGSQ